MNLMKKLSPYIRLGRYDKPIGAMLVFWPCSFAAALAAPGLPHLGWLGCAFGASFMMRAAGCVANDFWDRDIDHQVLRTRSRPITSGEVSLPKAFAFFLANLPPIPVSWMLMGPHAQSAILCSLPLMTLYPLAKRFTYWPQALLGLAMNYGFVVNYLFLTERLDPFILPVYLGCWCWTMVYDSIYAYQDTEDDLKVGVKSTALLWKEGYRQYCAAFTAAAAGLWGVGGYMAGLGPAFYPCLALAIGHIGYQWVTVDIKDPKDCWKKFSMNQVTGGIVFLAFVIGRVTQKSGEECTAGLEEKKDVLLSL